mmetsp:Transcript_26263/g.79144  ORF Transcript_26263/g.79144 Transcript_26263/m.79144 type:complete len:465 (-) Transcript_26263:370-1764(-)|eukprot:CAMPEP_0198493306 /NCGR_PEP_ID=MMETSP1462-20131121/3934_1 /TAXON_ID=1333877 /ORGANISM="Brandtodinium nutriculum, Strain RCC3387" /LENGTH=464 /DNA_ID=CAMNT_0044221985 /DNA_START=128 /DNA_END=1522 /DNA_ORIENTATION=+
MALHAADKSHQNVEACASLHQVHAEVAPGHIIDLPLDLLPHLVLPPSLVLRAAPPRKRGLLLNVAWVVPRRALRGVIHEIHPAVAVQRGRHVLRQATRVDERALLCGRVGEVDAPSLGDAHFPIRRASPGVDEGGLPCHVELVIHAARLRVDALVPVLGQEPGVDERGPPRPRVREVRAPQATAAGSQAGPADVPHLPRPGERDLLERLHELRLVESADLLVLLHLRVVILLLRSVPPQRGRLPQAAREGQALDQNVPALHLPIHAHASDHLRVRRQVLVHHGPRELPDVLGFSELLPVGGPREEHRDPERHGRAALRGEGASELHDRLALVPVALVNHGEPQELVRRSLEQVAERGVERQRARPRPATSLAERQRQLRPSAFQRAASHEPRGHGRAAVPNEVQIRARHSEILRALAHLAGETHRAHGCASASAPQGQLHRHRAARQGREVHRGLAQGLLRPAA